MRLVTAGTRPDQLKSPNMEDSTWDLILKCWKANPNERHSMEQIVKRMTPRANFRSLITDLNKVYDIPLSRHYTTTDNP